ncbi:CgeB family protein [Flavobacterium hauense]
MNSNSRIILIAPVYFNYHTLIIKSLEAKGHTVDFLEDKNSGLSYILSTKSKFLLKRYKEKYEKEVLACLDKGNYDCMIVIGGKTPDSDFWKRINQTYKFKKILYQWDSVRNFDYRSMIPSFDSVMTFDSQDALQLNIPYLPLFYKQKDKSEVAEDIDFLFIGIWHSDRIEILDKIAEYANANNLKYYFKVYYPWYSYLYLVHIKKTISPSPFLTSKPVPLEETIKYYQRAKCIIDINHPWQSGLTMRTIETIGKGKKLITTNSYITSETFYNPKMIQVIDRKEVKLDSNFFSFNEKYNDIERLEISNWVNKLLS